MDPPPFATIRLNYVELVDKHGNKTAFHLDFLSFAMVDNKTSTPDNWGSDIFRSTGQEFETKTEKMHTVVFATKEAAFYAANLINEAKMARTGGKTTAPLA